MTITQIDEDYQITIPLEIRELLQLEGGNKLEMMVQSGKIILFTSKNEILYNDYTLDELLAEEIEINTEIDWGKPEGSEIW